jgi:transcriptional regulator with XRE-family HTH domain
MSSIQQQMLEGLKSSKEYRHGFIEESIQSRLTAQINTLRKQQGWDLKTFADKLGKKLSWAYRLEDPNAAVPTIPTLLEVAETFDVGLDVRFRRFSELLDDAVNLTPSSFSVPSFESELANGAFARRRRSPKHRKALKARSRSEKVIPFRSRRKRRRIGFIANPNQMLAASYGT